MCDDPTHEPLIQELSRKAEGYKALEKRFEVLENEVSRLRSENELLLTRLLSFHSERQTR